jgi:hypothetical protein
MGGHVALKPMVLYEIIMGGQHKEDVDGEEVVATVTGNNLKVGIGLATYF